MLTRKLMAEIKYRHFDADPGIELVQRGWAKCGSTTVGGFKVNRRIKRGLRQMVLLFRLLNIRPLNRNRWMLNGHLAEELLDRRQSWQQWIRRIDPKLFFRR